MHSKTGRNHFFITLSCLVLFVSLISFSTDKTSGLAVDVVNQANQFRTSKALSKLIMKNELNAIAQKHSENMARGRVGFGHSGFAKRTAMAESKIKDVSSFAENVAYGSKSAKEVVNLWKNSTGHRRNMLGPYKYIGIGIAKNSRGIIYYTLIFGG